MKVFIRKYNEQDPIGSFLGQTPPSFFALTPLFKKNYFIYFLEDNYFTILWWLLRYISMNQPWVHMCSPILNLPPHPFPLGCPRAPALSALLHAWNLPLSSVLNMVIYMFQGYSLKSSHPHLLSESKSLFFTSVSFAVLHNRSSLPSF